MLSDNSLSNCQESGLSGILIIQDIEPSGGASLFFWGEVELVQLPFIMLNGVVQLQRKIRDD